MEKTGHIPTRFLDAAASAFKPAMRTVWWLIRLTVPVSLAMCVLGRLGVVEWISESLAPFFSLLGLDGRGALVWVSSMAGNLYTAIAVMFTVGVGLREAVILAVMCLICHNLIIETAIQKRTGAPAGGMICLRVGVSLLAGAALNLLLPAAMEGELHGATTGGAGYAATWGETLRQWAVGIAPLLVKMTVLVTLLNILQAVLREFGALALIARPLSPLMRLLGLPLSTSFLWIICNVIGLTYGGAALMDELERGEASPADARLLNTHVAISHSLLEDTLLFWAIGIPLFWLIVPRLALAAGAVWVQRFVKNARNKTSPRNVLAG